MVTLSKSPGKVTYRILIVLLNDLKLTPFVPLPLLRELIAGREGEVVIVPLSKDSCREAESEDVTLLVDFRKCDRVGELSDTLIRFMERGVWDYADRYGKRLTSEGFLDAGDFYEGRAAVETGTGWGLLNRQGEYVMNPGFESLEWHAPANVVSACADGKWELFDREGKQITAGSYDWIGDCSEGALVARRGNKLGYLRADGTSITDMRFDDAYSFRDGKAMVRLAGETYHINADGYKTA